MTKSLFLLAYTLLERPDPRSASSSCAYARELVRVAALPCRREHREINFRQKNSSVLEDFFFVFLPDGAKRLVFTMNYQLRDDQVFAILAPNWPTPLLAPGPPKGDSGRSRESPGRVWRSSVRVPGGPIYRKTPDQPPQRPLC